MPSHNGSIIHRIRTLSAALGAAQPDADLVEQFVLRRDEASFEALLKRHGPMIMRLCRRLLPSEQDAEDVFQATFLILARKAAAVRKAASIGPWLYGVAYRIAMKSRSATSRCERAVKAPDAAAGENALDRLSVREAEALLLEELARLPVKYRDPLVLCHLEGKTRDEAARVLGCPLGTLKERLQRGKDMLHARLTRRGVTLSAALVAGLFAETVSSAAVKDGLVRSTLQATVEPVRQVSAPIALLASAGARTVGAGGMKLATGLMAATVLIGFAAGLANFVAAVPAKKDDAKETVAADLPPQANPKDPKGKRLDALGDPLPDGAVMRLGTRRHRVQTWPLKWQSLPDGKSYLSLQRTGTATEIRRIDAETGVVVETWPVPERQDVAGFSPNGRFMLLTNHFIFFSGFRLQGQKESQQQWLLTLYDLANRKEVWSNSKMLDEKDWAHAGNCRFSANGKWIVTTGQYGRGAVRVWDGATGKQLWQHKSEGQSFDPLGFADGGKLVALRGQNDGYIYLHDRVTGKETRSFPTASTKEYPGGALLSPDGSQFVIGGWDPKPRVWDLAGKELPALEGHKEWARELAFSTDGKKLYTGGSDSFVLEREWPSGKVLRTIDLGRKGVSEMAVSGDGKRLAVMFWGEQALAFYDLEMGKRVPEPIEAHRSAIYGIACAPDGSLVTFGRDSTVHTWDVKEGKTIAQFKVELDLNAGGFALSADGKRVAVPKRDIDGIHIYERASGKLIRTIPADHWSMRQLVFSPDGLFLAAIDSTQGTAQVRATDSGKLVLKFKTRQAGNGNGAGTFSPNGSIFAFADHGLVRLWDTATWKEVNGITEYSTLGLAYSPDGRMLATASEEGVRIFEVGTKRERVHVRPEGCPSGSLRFSRSGRYLAWVSDRTKVNVLDVRTGALMGPFAGHDDSITGLAFTIDEKAVASSSADSTILLWSVAGTEAKNPALGDDVNQAWRTLSSEDAKTAFAAIRTLAASPEKAVKRIGERFKPMEPLDKEWVAARLRDLDSPKFAERDRATRELEKAGERIVPFLEKFLAGKLSVEARERAEHMVAKVRGPADESGRVALAHRGLEVLEWIGNDTARELVELLAKGAAGSALTEDAKETLGRWRR